VQLPKRVDQHIIESLSFKIFSNALPDDWIIREVTERDYGIDCYIEICNKGLITGQLISVQLKGSENIALRDDDQFVTYYSISPSKLNYWNNLPVPIVFLFIDIKTHDIYFSNVKSYIRQNYNSFKNEKLTSLTIPIKNKIDKITSRNIFEAIYLIENNRNSFELILSNFVISIFKIIEFLSDHYGRDCFLPLDEEVDDELHFLNLYRDAKYLANFYNINWTIKSINEIIEEGQKMFGESYIFYEYQIAVFVKQIVPIIKNVISEIKNQITKFEADYWENNNYPLWRYLSTRAFYNIIEELEKF
jgi:hypothetical protein